MSDPFELRSADYVTLLRGPVADPAISMLLKREHLAAIKVHQLEMEIQQLEQHIGTLRMQVDMLRKEYRVG